MLNRAAVPPWVNPPTQSKWLGRSGPGTTTGIDENENDCRTGVASEHVPAGVVSETTPLLVTHLEHCPEFHQPNFIAVHEVHEVRP